MKYKAEDNLNMYRILSSILKNPEKAESVPDFIENEVVTPKMFSSEKALGIMISLNLSKAQYIHLRKASLEENINQYPSYYQIQKAKFECYPPQSSITVSETEAKIQLQSLLDHTTNRILNINNVKPETRKLILISKWGCDGASGQSIYKQKFQTGHIQDDSSFFISTLVPIKLFDPETTKIFWENSRPSSTRFCRPIKYQFAKESPTVIQNEIESIRNEIQNLLPTICGGLEIQHKLLLTMIDGKICNTLTQNSSSMRCYLCNAKPTEMNNIELALRRPVKEDFYELGLSPLHAWIRSYECLLHISYNLDFKKWSATSEESKTLQKKRKKEIHEKFRREVGRYLNR